MISNVLVYRDIPSGILHCLGNISKCLKNAIFGLGVLTCSLYIESAYTSLTMCYRKVHSGMGKLIPLTNPNGKFESSTDARVRKLVYIGDLTDRHFELNYLPRAVISSWEKSQPSLKRPLVLSQLFEASLSRYSTTRPRSPSIPGFLYLVYHFLPFAVFEVYLHRCATFALIGEFLLDLLYEGEELILFSICFSP